eukprot:1158963-Pelagomonas_calceolata.AAC.2
MAVRMPAHPVARALIALSGCPLAAPSANSSGRPSPTRAQHVVEDLGERVALVVDGGPCQWGVESTVSGSWLRDLGFRVRTVSVERWIERGMMVGFAGCAHQVILCDVDADVHTPQEPYLLPIELPMYASCFFPDQIRLKVVTDGIKLQSLRI